MPPIAYKCNQRERTNRPRRPKNVSLFHCCNCFYCLFCSFDHRRGFGRALDLLPIRLSSGLFGCKVATPPFISLPETTVPRVLLLRVQRLSFLPLRWAASLLGLRSVPCPIILSCHWTSLLLGGFKVLPQAHDHLDLFSFLNLVQRYYIFLICANFFHYFL